MENGKLASVRLGEIILAKGNGADQQQENFLLEKYVDLESIP